MHNFFRKLFITLIRAGDQFNWKSRHLKEFSKLAFVNMAQDFQDNDHGKLHF